MVSRCCRHSVGGDSVESEHNRLVAVGDSRLAVRRNGGAIAATVCDGDVTVMGAEASAKSYPAFWDDLSTLGVTITKDEE